MRDLAPRLRRLRARGRGGIRVDPDAFVAELYRKAFDRGVDADAARYYRKLIEQGYGLADVAVLLCESEEFVNRRLADSFAIPSLEEQRPEAYVEVDGSRVFVAEDDADFDWLEAAILENGYYEKPGVWTLEVDLDKRLLAEIIASFQPRRSLELGCSSGSVIGCLLAEGVQAEGVDISQMALRRAEPEVRTAIHLGDLLSLQLPAGAYDVVAGFDVFEHLNPNRLDAYLAEVARLVAPGGFVFANLPAFGEDRVFGTVFPLTLAPWRDDVAAGRRFRHLEVDGDGYPQHGHLVWADTGWWEARFAAAGLVRQPEIERALHRRYDAAYDRISVARKAFFVCAADPDPARTAAVLDGLAQPSAVLAAHEAALG